MDGFSETGTFHQYSLILKTGPILTMDDFEALATKEEIHEAVSSVYHELNNPLSIISGNAQFLLELSQEEGLDEQFVSSVQDIQEATEQMSESLQRLTHLRDQLEDEQ